MMTNQWQSANIILGVGGKRPGVGIYNIDTGLIENTISLTAGESVYAVDVLPNSNSLIVGTRAGFLYLLGQEELSQQNSDFEPQRFIQGASVLSVCSLDEQRVAVSDVAGRCLIWELTKNSQPMPLPTGDGAVCALFRADDGLLAGISMAGELVVWDLMQSDIIRVLDIPTPPALSALIKPIYWRARNSWAWPGKDGVVVLYQCSQNKITTMNAHTGDVYAMAVCNDELLTIGRTDGCMKRWQANSDKPVASFKAPKGVISASIWGGQDFRMLLINDLGKAGIYSFINDKIKFIGLLHGRDYRITIDPDLDKYQAQLSQKKIVLAENISLQIKDKIAKHRYDGLAQLHQQLIDLGFRHVSLLLIAEEEAGKNDLVAELKAYRDLDQLLCQNNMSTSGSLFRYAKLLEETWHLQLARLVYERLLKNEPNNNVYRESIDKLTGHLETIENDEYVIETDLPLETVVESAMALNEPVTGRYFINNIGTPISCNGNISAGEFIERYEKIRQKRTDVALPIAEEKNICWFSKDRYEWITTITFADDTSNCAGELQFGIKVLNTTMRTVLVPVILFDASQNGAKVPVEKHNRSILERLGQNKEKLMSNARLNMIHTNINHVIRQLITREMSQRIRSAQ